MKFNKIIGNDKIKYYLEECLINNKFSHSYLFSGTEGIGKLLIAKEFSRKILCLEHKSECNCKSCQCFENSNHPDFLLVNLEGENIKIEQIREITNKVIEQPIISSRKIYIINDCEKMTVEAQNCLLKTLEEPPEFAILILITSNESKVLNTIKSRCMKIKFQDISDEELKKYAIENLRYENIDKTLLKSFGGSIKKATIQKNNQEKYTQIKKIIDMLKTNDIIEILTNAKFLYDKEEIDVLLEYLMICCFEKSKNERKYINCIEKINKCQERLKSNCNFDMCIDNMLFEIWEEFK